MSYGPRSASTAAQLLLPIHNNDDNNARSLSAKDVIAARFFFPSMFIRRRGYDYFTFYVRVRVHTAGQQRYRRVDQNRLADFVPTRVPVPTFLLSV